MFSDYKTLVVRDYQKKRKANILPPALVRPSPARLRAVCMMICEDRFNPKDLPTLRTFFGACVDKSTCLKAIDRYDTGKFKALGNFLKGETTAPDDKIVELLAWLIDFTPRPHEFGRTYQSISHEDDMAGQDISQPIENQPVQEQPKEYPIGPPTSTPLTPPNDKTATPNRKRRRLITALSILLLGAAIYWWIHASANAPHACMFWTGDHYQPIPCNQHPENAFVIPLDSEKMVHLRKITRPDTITENALGSIWYVKYHDNYECYTAPGYHPIDSNLKLRPLTDYVLLRYIHPGLQPAVLPTH
jgi:hypothetical protein